MARASREVRKGRAIRGLRWVFLGATLAATALVVVLYLAGRSDRPPAPADDLDELVPGGDLVTVGEGFERTFSEGDRPVFTVRGDSYAVDRSGIVHLEGVEVAIYQEDGSQYVIEGARARFDVEKREGRLAGGVVVTAPGELVLTTAGLRVIDGGRQVRSTTDVEFRIGQDYRGEAHGLHAWLVPRQLRLERYVKIVSLPGAAEPLRLEAAGLVLDRGRHLIRSEGWAVLHRRAERLTALRMHLFFDEDDSTLRFVRGQWQVTGLFLAGGVLRDLPPDAPPGAEAGPATEGLRRLTLRSELLTLLLTEDGRHPEQVDLEGGPGGRASLRAQGPAGTPSHRLTAPALTGWLEQGVLSRAEATGGASLVVRGSGAASPDGGHRVTAATLTGRFEGGALARADGAGGVTLVTMASGEEAEGEGDGEAGSERRATGREAVASFDGEGALTQVELTGDVVLTDRGTRATGERGLFDAGRDRGELFGRPAVVETDAGRMEAPRVLYTRSDGLAHGTGGVRARLDRAGESVLGGTPLGRGDGPVWVEAEQGFFRDQPRAFLFKGRVRAWRGDDLLVADELLGDEPEDRLVATGQVRTLWTPEDGTGIGGEGPLEVRSGELVYRRSARLLLYTGEVVARQEERTMTCRELDVALAEGGGVAELTCVGAARVEDAETGRTLAGERVRYDPGRRLVVVVAAEGGKVTLREREGNVIEGPCMEYDLEADRVRVLGRDCRPAAPPAREGGEPGGR